MKLEIAGEIIIQKPTDEDLEEAIYNLDEFVGSEFLILEQDEMTYLQLSKFPETGKFIIEYQEGSIERHFQSIRNDYKTEEMLSVLEMYNVGDSKFKNGIEWKKTTIQPPE